VLPSLFRKLTSGQTGKPNVASNGEEVIDLVVVAELVVEVADGVDNNDGAAVSVANNDAALSFVCTTWTTVSATSANNRRGCNVSFWADSDLEKGRS
jgi:hypothetical protein